MKSYTIFIYLHIHFPVRVILKMDSIESKTYCSVLLIKVQNIAYTLYSEQLTEGEESSERTYRDSNSGYQIQNPRY